MRRRHSWLRSFLVEIRVSPKPLRSNVYWQGPFFSIKASLRFAADARDACMYWILLAACVVLMPLEVFFFEEKERLKNKKMKPRDRFFEE
jgi:hypothetical protein